MSKLTNELYFQNSLAFLKFVKIREFQEFLKFIKFEFSIYAVAYIYARPSLTDDSAE